MTRKRKGPKQGRPKIARDESGWRIPQVGTLSREIYDRLKMGMRPKQISEELKADAGKVRVLSHRVRNPETRYG